MMRPPDGRIGRDRDEPAKESYALHIKRVAMNVVSMAMISYGSRAINTVVYGR